MSTDRVPITIGNIPIAKAIRKGEGADRQNLVFGWANAPFPGSDGPEVVSKRIYGNAPDGSLDEILQNVEEAYSRAFPSDHEMGTWYFIVATFTDHVIVEHQTFGPKPDTNKLFITPYTGGPDSASIVFGTPAEVEVEFVAKAIADDLLEHHTSAQPKVDLQGDRVPMDELEQAIYKFVLDSGRADVSHSEEVHGRLVESIVITDEKLIAMGVPEEVHDQITKGAWLGFQVDDATMDRVESGELAMFSIGGGAVRDPD
ncbi:hypothetical protein LCGC14_0955380 [marine sediment metagenome]|uniref:Phage-like element PBSX protein XkdF domain-containing protein n=1 Tax=marine sediment metagenome TaxID=412755 RepID=A0A0F9NFZ4_9ZZZZ